MGNFYSNITLSTGDQKAVVDHLIASKRQTLVCRQENFVCVFPARNAGLLSLAKFLSDKLQCAALAVRNHDDHIFIYQLFELGVLVDDYNSSPGYFDQDDRHPSGGDAKKLCEIYGVPNKSDAIHELLQKKYTFELNRHDALVDTLGLPICTAGSGFKTLSEGEVPKELDSSTLIETNSDGEESDGEESDAE